MIIASLEFGFKAPANRLAWLFIYLTLTMSFGIL